MLRSFADLVVDSEVPFDDLPRAGAPAQITIRRGRMPSGTWEPLQTWHADDGSIWLAIARGASGYRVTLPGLECAIDHGGTSILFEPAASLAAAELVHLLLHQVLPLAVSRMGRIVLHACAVDSGAGAVAFLAQSGAGKSTLAAAFCRRGSALIADDALVVDASGETIAVWPTADGVRLWDDMQPVAPRARRARDAARGKLRAPVPIACRSAALARIYLLDTRQDGRVTIDPAGAAAVRLELLSHVFRLDVNDAIESRRLFDAAHDIVSRVPARTITYPNGLEYLDAVVDAVLEDLA